jgi:hypothetical protein
MKKLTGLLLPMLFIVLLISCTKNAPEEQLQESENAATKVMLASDPLTNPAPRQILTDEQLISMGKANGCLLAKLAGYELTMCEPRIINGVVQINAAGDTLIDCTPNSGYSVYLNTVNNPNFPEIYRDAVRQGFLECQENGTSSGNSFTCEYSNWLKATPSTAIRQTCKASAKPANIQ